MRKPYRDLLHPLKGLYKSRRQRLNRQAQADSAAAAASSKGEQSLQLQDKADDPTTEADRAGRSGSETSDRPKEAAPVTGAPEGVVVAIAPQGKCNLAHRLLKSRLPRPLSSSERCAALVGRTPRRSVKLMRHIAR